MSFEVASVHWGLLRRVVLFIKKIRWLNEAIQYFHFQASGMAGATHFSLFELRFEQEMQQRLSFK
jgi:hypothetical protein